MIGKIIELLTKKENEKETKEVIEMTEIIEKNLSMIVEKLKDKRILTPILKILLAQEMDAIDEIAKEKGWSRKEVISLITKEMIKMNKD